MSDWISTDKDITKKVMCTTETTLFWSLSVFLTTDPTAFNATCKEDPINIQDVMDGLVIGDGSVHKASNNLLYLCIGENDKDYFIK